MRGLIIKARSYRESHIIPQLLPRQYARFYMVSSSRVSSAPTPTPTPPFIAHHTFTRKVSTFSMINDTGRLNSQDRSRILVNHSISPTMSEAEIESMEYAFLSATDNSNGVLHPETIETAIRIWSQAFHISDERRNAGSVSQLQRKLISAKSQFITFLMNHKRYDLYLKHVHSLYSTHHLFQDLEPEWPERVFQIIKFQDEEIDSDRIKSFLADQDEDIEKRRMVLTTMLKKGFLYSETRLHSDSLEIYVDRRDSLHYYIETFFEYLPLIEGDISNLAQGMHTYKGALNLLIRIPNISTILKRVYDQQDDTQSYLDVLSVLLGISVRYNQSKIALSFWNEKVDFHKQRQPTTSPFAEPSKRKMVSSLNILTKSDLTNVMQATFNTGLYAKTIELYKEWQYLLKDDSQIEVLLKIAERERDWKALQKQFEEMYGRGTLPHKVHYGIVMNALASIGAKDEVITLFKQLLRRNLTPNTAIISALLNSALYYGDFNEANRIIEEYVAKNDAISSPYLYQIVFKFFEISNDLDTSMTWFKRILASGQTELLGTDSIISIIRVCKKNYALKELNFVWSHISSDSACDHLLQLQSYVEMVKAYTKFSLHEKAEELCNQAIENSIHPYLSGKLFTVKLANYKRWLQNYQFHTVQQADYFHDQIKQIISLNNNNKLAQDTSWFVELIKYYIYKYDSLDEAKAILGYLKRSNLQLLHERHFHPIMDYHIRKGQHNEVLELFKEMTSSDVNVTILSHYKLMSALTFLDRIRGKEFTNSTNLLKAVYEINGLSTDMIYSGSSGDSTFTLAGRQVPKGELYKNVEVLANITMTYIVAKNEVSGNTLLFNFLEQVRTNTNDKVTNTFKYPLYKNIYRYYLKQGNYAQANSLVDTIFEDLIRTIKRYINEYKEVVAEHDFNKGEFFIPRSIETNFQYYFLIKLNSLSAKGIDKDSKSEAILKLAKSCEDCQIHLSNFGYNQLISNLVQGRSKETLFEALRIAEENLTSGNFKVISIEKSKQYILRSLLRHLSTSMDSTALKEKYNLLIDYYSIKMKDLSQHTEKNDDTIDALQVAIDSYNKKSSEKDILNDNELTVNGLLEKDFEFFNPPTANSNHLVIQSHTLRLLLARFKKYIKSNPKDAQEIEMFKLMDEFPLTIEFLLLANSRAPRIAQFMKVVDAIQPPPVSDQLESNESRKERIITVLKQIQGQYKPRYDDSGY